MKDHALKEELRRILASEEEPQGEAKPVHISDLLVELEKGLDKPPPRRIATGFGHLDWLLDGGFAPGELIYVAGSAGTGKTLLALQFAVPAARAGWPTLISSHEMMNTALTRRMMSQTSGVEARKFKTHSFEANDINRILEATGEMSRYPLWLMDNATEIGQLVDIVGTYKEEHNLGLFVVDYLQLVAGLNDRTDARARVECVSRGLKGIARLMGISVVAISAINRPVKGQDPEPTLNSLRESGNLEHDCDIAILMYRPKNGIDCKVNVAKNRDGECGYFNLDFDRERVRFQKKGEGYNGE